MFLSIESTNPSKYPKNILCFVTVPIGRIAVGLSACLFICSVRGGDRSRSPDDIRKFVKMFYPLWKQRLLTKPCIALQPGWNLPTLGVRLSKVCMGIHGCVESHEPFYGWG